ncbi:BMP family ABC transporter substrate-binding protein [Anaerocolumna cellulosilytica]|uniref:BMP family ABC transporter substrate-binding protein n=1 Tax=Anaerocolumna cellulosilytica TaxID=433286 RepID=A0A6S6R1H9_9FIRM|nr:BMP family ABC transporter substrate-binding protein [Anaerocolumna cellulosilytica]MBB5195404.1 basic membrane protein A [Anaerocolumna cellulosilytica]BCJ95936.1 BMP family ABC transporter substrate-binding protein [Anaerocolumna cellulosilytica]
MKKTLIVLLAMVLCIAGITGCSKKEEEKKYTAALLIPYQGDQSFYDLAVEGMKLVDTNLSDVSTKIIEIGTDDSKWKSYFIDAAEEGYDVILSCNWQIAPYMNEVAAEYPDQKFINFDIEDAAGLDNVYSMFYSTNEIGYLCGVVAAATTTSDMELADENATIGFIGGMDIPGINDFMVGYVEGAKSVNPDIKVAVSYVGGFQDVATAKEIALNQYKTGVDVIFACAGNAGNGVIDAANELNKYVIGVDSDQALLYAETDEAKAQKIITSGYKTIDKTILTSVTAAKEGTLSWGTHVQFGFKEDGIGIAKNKFYEAAATDNVKAAVDSAEKALKDGALTISSAFDMDDTAISKFRETVQP